MSNTRSAILTRNAKLGAVNAQLANGYLRVYDGAQPATPETSIGTATLLFELRFGATAFGAAVGGSMTANSIAAVNAVAAGKAQFLRTFQSDGTTAVYDGSVDLTGSGADLEVSDINVTVGALVSPSALALAEPM